MEFAQAAPSPLGQALLHKTQAQMDAVVLTTFVLLGLLPSSVRVGAIVLGFCEFPRPQKGEVVEQGNNFWLSPHVAL